MWTKLANQVRQVIMIWSVVMSNRCCLRTIYISCNVLKKSIFFSGIWRESMSYQNITSCVVSGQVNPAKETHLSKASLHVHGAPRLFTKEQNIHYQYVFCMIIIFVSVHFLCGYFLLHAYVLVCRYVFYCWLDFYGNRFFLSLLKKRLWSQ